MPRRLFTASCTALAATMLSIWALPAGLAVIFAGLYLSDRLGGGYRVEHIGDTTAA